MTQMTRQLARSFGPVATVEAPNPRRAECLYSSTGLGVGVQGGGTQKQGNMSAGFKDIWSRLGEGFHAAGPTSPKE